MLADSVLVQPTKEEICSQLDNKLLDQPKELEWCTKRYTVVTQRYRKAENDISVHAQGQRVGQGSHPASLMTKHDPKLVHKGRLDKDKLSVLGHTGQAGKLKSYTDAGQDPPKRGLADCPMIHHQDCVLPSSFMAAFVILPQIILDFTILSVQLELVVTPFSIAS